MKKISSMDFSDLYAFRDIDEYFLEIEDERRYYVEDILKKILVGESYIRCGYNKESCVEYSYIRYSTITKFKLSELEEVYLIKLLKDNNIGVTGRGLGDYDICGNYDSCSNFKNVNSVNYYVSDDTNVENIREYRLNGSKKLKEKIVFDNLRLLRNACYDYSKICSYDEYDLESFGYEGLDNAIETYDVDSGICFSTYAVCCIKNTLYNGVISLKGCKRSDIYSKYYKSKKQIEREEGSFLEDEFIYLDDIVKRMINEDNKFNFDYNRLKNYLASFNPSYVSELDDIAGCFSYDGDIEFTIDMHYCDELRKVLDEALSILKERDRKLILDYFKLSDEKKDYSYTELGVLYGLSREGVRRVLIRSYEKIRNSEYYEKLKPFLSYETNDSEKIAYYRK